MQGTRSACVGQCSGNTYCGTELSHVVNDGALERDKLRALLADGFSEQSIRYEAENHRPPR